MRCPRCSQPVEHEDLYCLNCGKQLKEDDAFIGEFDEEFAFDEERAESGTKSDAPTKELKELAEQVPVDALRRSRSVWTAIAAFLVLLACMLAYLLFSGSALTCVSASQNGGATGKTSGFFPARDRTIAQSDREEIKELCRTLAVAASTTYDLDAILACVPPQMRRAVEDALCAQYRCGTREELEARFSELAKTNVYLFSDLVCEIPQSAYDADLEAESLARIQERYGVLPDDVELMTSVGVSGGVIDPEGIQSETYFSYLVAKIGAAWYVLE